MVHPARRLADRRRLASTDRGRAAASAAATGRRGWIVDEQADGLGMAFGADDVPLLAAHAECCVGDAADLQLEGYSDEEPPDPGPHRPRDAAGREPRLPRRPLVRRLAHAVRGRGPSPPGVAHAARPQLLTRRHPRPGRARADLRARVGRGSRRGNRYPAVGDEGREGDRLRRLGAVDQLVGLEAARREARSRDVEHVRPSPVARRGCPRRGAGPPPAARRPRPSRPGARPRRRARRRPRAPSAAAAAAASPVAARRGSSVEWERT